MPSNQLKYYKDKGAKQPFNIDFGMILMGEKSKLNVYAKNEGDTDLVNLKVLLKNDDMKVENGVKALLKVDGIWEFILIFTPKMERKVKNIEEEFQIAGIEVPRR